MTQPPSLTRWDRFTLAIAPRWTLNRLRARAAAFVSKRHYGAAQPGRRTSGWARNYGDANAVIGRALVELRLHARDLVRNNSLAARAVEIITGNTVGWGITPKPVGPNAAAVARTRELWKAWAGTAQCDAEGRLNFYGLQELALRTVVEAGEVLIRRRWRRPEDGFAVPLQIQILEPDFIDSSKESDTSLAGGPIVQGIEFDKLGRRAAYWLFEAHPGSSWSTGTSRRVRASELIHVYRTLRPSQCRGVTWLAQTIAPLKDFDEYEDATLLRQKIAACFAAFVVDPNGDASALADEHATDPVETFEPGMIHYLKIGEDVKFANPPLVTDESFTVRTARKIAAGMSVTYEDLTGDYSQVNFSSARMSRLAHWAHVYKWQWNMLIPQLCDGVFAWFVEAAIVAGELSDADSVRAEWSTPPMPMIEPDKEGLAIQRLVRTGARTISEMIREQGKDPEDHFAELAADFKKLDALGLKLDIDPRAVSQAGLTQERAGAGGGGKPGGEKEEERVSPELEALALRAFRGGKP